MMFLDASRVIYYDSDTQQASPRRYSRQPLAGWSVGPSSSLLLLLFVIVSCPSRSYRKFVAVARIRYSCDRLCCYNDGDDDNDYL